MFFFSFVDFYFSWEIVFKITFRWKTIRSLVSKRVIKSSTRYILSNVGFLSIWQNCCPQYRSFASAYKTITKREVSWKASKNVWCTSVRFFLPVLLEIIEYLTKQTRNFNFRVRIGKFSLFSNINRETIWELLSSLVNEGLCFSGEEIKNFINSSVNENEYSNRYLRLQDTTNVKC